MVSALLASLQDQSEDVRSGAAYALSNAAANPEVVSALLAALQDQSEDVRSSAAYAVARVARHASAVSLVALPDRLAGALNLPGWNRWLPSPDGRLISPRSELLEALMAVAPGPTVPEE